jgi:hypothetical protein
MPNPALEPTQAKLVLEAQHSLPRHADIARAFHDRERPPILELIYPMATSARDVDRVREYYERFVAGMEHAVLGGDEGPLGTWFGRARVSTARSPWSGRWTRTSPPEIARAARGASGPGGAQLGELIVRAGAIRRFLG